MSDRFRLRSTERVVISVRPTAQGLMGPLLTTVVAGGAVVVAGLKLGLVHQHEGVVFTIVAGVPAIVLAARLWRWRARMIVVTSEQIVVQQGVIRRSRTSVALDDIATMTVRQRLRERLVRRGEVVVVTLASELVLGPLRHPSALARLIEQARRESAAGGRPYDTQFVAPTEIDRWPRGGVAGPSRDY